MKASIVDLI